MGQTWAKRRECPEEDGRGEIPVALAKEFPNPEQFSDFPDLFECLTRDCIRCRESRPTEKGTGRVISEHSVGERYPTTIRPIRIGPFSLLCKYVKSLIYKHSLESICLIVINSPLFERNHK